MSVYLLVRISFTTYQNLFTWISQSPWQLWVFLWPQDFTFHRKHYFFLLYVQWSWWEPIFFENFWEPLFFLLDLYPRIPQSPCQSCKFFLLIVHEISFWLKKYGRWPSKMRKELKYVLNGQTTKLFTPGLPGYHFKVQNV